MPALAGVFAVLALAPGAAQAASSPAHAVVIGCKDDHMTVAGAVKLAGAAARKARGAQLQLQFRAMPLFGIPRPGAWRTIGTRTSGSGQQAFTGLAADSWSGLMLWRFKKGARTLLSGTERSQPGRAGAVAGAGFCTLSEGLKPPDKNPPTLFVTPVDEVWHHGPEQVYVQAQDDFSGVRGVTYSIDGGPATAVRNASTFAIATEGAHNVRLTATDVAGNTATRDVVERVDTSAPAKPQLTRPFSVTANATPTFSWTASSDTGSGLKGYFLTIRRVSDGSTVAFTPYDAATTSGAPQALNDGESYTATVIAVDNTDVPFSTESDALSFHVDTHPGLTGSSPADGAIVSGSGKDANLTLTLDRPADPSTVASSTVVLDRNSESGADPSYSVGCDASCTTITVDPSGTLGEGRYSLSLNGVKSQEGVAIPGTVHFAVAFREDPSGGSGSSSPCTGGDVPTPDNDPPATQLNVAATEGGTLTFSYSVQGSGHGGVRIKSNGTAIGDSGPLTGSGNASVAFTLPQGNNQTITVEYYASCPLGDTATTTINVTNLIASRNP